MSHCSSWSERLGALGGTASVHLIPGSVACPERSQFARADSVSWLAPTSGTAASQDRFVRMRQRPVQWQPSSRRRPQHDLRFIDFFNSLADASITKKLLREIERVSHDRYVTRASTTLSSHEIRYSPMLNNELLTPSHPEVRTQGDLKVSVKEIDDLRRGAVRLSPNGRVSATASYLSRKL